MSRTTGPRKFAIVYALIGSLLWATVPHHSFAEPVTDSNPPPGLTRGTAYIVVPIDLQTATRLTSGQLTQEQWTALMNSVLPSGSLVSVGQIDWLVQTCQSSAGLFPPPTGPDGRQRPPPLRLREVVPGQTNPWRAIPGTPSRPTKWIPTYPIPGQSQPGGSWDTEHGHWDIDNGSGVRDRCTPEGRAVGTNHQPTGEWLVPSGPFVELDVGDAPQVSCVGCSGLELDWFVPELWQVGAVVVVIVIVVLVATFPWGWVPALLCAAVVPAP